MYRRRRTAEALQSAVFISEIEGQFAIRTDTVRNKETNAQNIVAQHAGIQRRLSDSKHVRGNISNLQDQKSEYEEMTAVWDTYKVRHIAMLKPDAICSGSGHDQDVDVVCV